MPAGKAVILVHFREFGRIARVRGGEVGDRCGRVSAVFERGADDLLNEAAVKVDAWAEVAGSPGSARLREGFGRHRPVSCFVWC